MSNLENLVNQTRLATDFARNKATLTEKIQTDLHFTYNGGLFKATPDLIAFVHAWSGTKEIWPWDTNEMFLEDTYGNPIHISNRQGFYQQACEHYQAVMNTWHQEHAELKKLRKL
jgi:hypothetical protein